MVECKKISILNMELLFDRINIILLIILVLNLVLGLLIYLKGRGRKVNFFYSLNVVAIIGWILAMIIYRAVSQENSLFWCVVLYISPTFIASSFLYFTYIFPYQVKELAPSRKVLIVLGNVIIILFVLIPDFIIKDVTVRPGMEKFITFGPGYIFYVIYTAFYFSYGFWRLFKKYIGSRGIERNQIIYLLSGYSIAANSAFVTNMFMPWFGRMELNWLGQVLSIFMIGSISYAILRYRLMDIRLVVKRSTIFSLIVIVITAVYAMAAFLIGWITFGGVYTFKTQVITGLVVALLVAIGFRPLYEWIRRTTDSFLFTGEYKPQELMANISDVVSRTLDLDVVIDTLKEEITGALRIKRMEIIILENGGPIKGKYEAAPNPDIDLSVAKGNFLMTSKRKKSLEKIVRYFGKRREVLVLEELKRKYAEGVGLDKKSSLIDEIEEFRAALVVPLLIKKKLVGLFLLREKRSGDMFTNEDIKTLETIAAQAGIAIENARLYEEMRDFSKTLQKEVNRQTKELRDANIRLQQLDKAKSEFISLASHQLRTPLTIIKGYISMMLEGTWGQIVGKQREQLDKVYSSNERLVRLVEDLLTVSRIESGRLEFNWQLVSLEEMIDSVIKEFSQVAADKKLYLKFIPPKKVLPKVKMDSLKIRQVVQNLVDNALHYTKKGGAAISLEQKRGKVVFSIKDTGIGILPKEQVTLFEKFSRGREIGKMHTEGVGLGLYLSAKMIEAHHGRIWVESGGGGSGSTFFFELPIKGRRGKK